MKVEKLNLRHLRGFAKVASTGSVTHGAALASMSQPALSQAIAQLEKQFETKLFYRQRTGIFPTDAGLILARRIESAFLCLQTGVKLASSVARRDGYKTFSFENLITTTQIRSLLAVAKAGNYSLAARHSGLTQPSIHRTAKELEQIAGFPLFTKTRHGIDLTDAAQQLARYFTLMLTELMYGYEEMSALRGMESTRIAVGTLPFARSQLLPDAIKHFLKEHPKVDFFVQDGPYSSLLSSLRRGELDMLVGALREMPPADDVIQHHLFDDRLAIISRADHPILRERDITWNELCTYSWVVPRAGTPTRQYFETMVARVTTPDKIHIVETSSLGMIRGLLVGSDLLTLSSMHQIETEVRLGLLTQVKFDMVGADRQIGLTTRLKWAPTRIRQRFVDILKSEGLLLVDNSTD